MMMMMMVMVMVMRLAAQQPAPPPPLVLVLVVPVVLVLEPGARQHLLRRRPLRRVLVHARRGELRGFFTVGPRGFREVERRRVAVELLHHQRLVGEGGHRGLSRGELDEEGA